jgi:hypothetical protein
MRPPLLGEERGEDVASARQRTPPAGHLPSADLRQRLLHPCSFSSMDAAAGEIEHKPTTERKTRRQRRLRRSWSAAHGLPLDDWRLRKKLTCGAHMSASETENNTKHVCTNTF